MTEILKDCPNCEGSKYCITKPNKNDYKFPEEENQYLIDLECGIWDCHTAVSKLLKENVELKAEIESLNGEIRVLIGANQQLNSMFKVKDECAREYIEQIEKMKCCGNCEFKVHKNCEGTVWMGKEYCDKWELTK